MYFETIPKIDESIILWLNAKVGTFIFLDNIAKWIVSDYFVPVSICLTLLFLWFYGRTTIDSIKSQTIVLSSLMSMILSNIIILTSNLLYFRERPYESLDLNLLFYQPTDSSFPANSCTVTTAIATTILLKNPRFGLPLAVLVLIFGISRIYAGVHYPSDIVAGWILGILTATIIYYSESLLSRVYNIIFKFTRAICLS
jgi:undecaprenyl-diphosphatase